MHRDKEFDYAGHHRPPEHDKWLAELAEQLRKHTWSCTECLRVAAGLKESTRCWPAKSINKRIELIKQAQQRGMQ